VVLVSAGGVKAARRPVRLRPLMTSPKPRHRPNKAHPGARVKTRLADTTDRHDLYQRAVQCVEAEIDFVDETFKTLRGRRAKVLREDFCGTANTSCEWVRRRTGNRAVGLDLDQATMDWGLAHGVASLRAPQRRRLTLVRQDVLTAGARVGGERGFDVVLAMNFSYFIFKKREVMRRYFKSVRASLASDGVFFMDFFGGADCLRVLKERRAIPRATKGEPAMTAYTGPFTYIWDHAAHDPISGDMVCKIHFAFPDGSRMRDAFTYEWRLWQLPELREILAEAGFSRTTVYWEGDDGEGGGDGIFKPAEKAETSASYICYVSAER
jgi:hypothetical protein